MRVSIVRSWQSAAAWLEVLAWLAGGAALVAAAASFVYVKAAGAVTIVVSFWR